MTLSELIAADYVGILGSLLIAGAYFAVSRGLVAPERPTFHLLNLAGAIFILISLYYRPNPGAILIEVLWVAIAATALFRWALRRRR